MTTTKTADDLLDVIFATIDGVRAGAIDLDKARAINDLAQTAVNVGKAQTDHAKITDGRGSRFLDSGDDNRLRKPLPNGIIGVRRHLLKGD